ncbi:MAG: ABC transporter ATP-binding protein [Candidatus Muiribacteriaceae bacterium]
MGDNKVYAVDGVDLEIERGEFCSIMGHSGSGKSTLMHLLGCLDTPTSGKYLLDDVDISSLGDEELSKMRNRRIGFVFQSFNLLSHRDITFNVELPMIYGDVDAKQRKERAEKTLSALGLSERLLHRPTELSGGQNQRVAIARSLVMSPDVIFADEPTGNLDSKTSFEILALFQKLNELGKTVIMVTHEPDIAEHTRRIIEVRDGKVIRDEKNQDYRVLDIKLDYDLKSISGG